MGVLIHMDRELGVFRDRRRVRVLQKKLLDEADQMVQPVGDAMDVPICHWMPAHDHSRRCIFMVLHQVKV